MAKSTSGTFAHPYGVVVELLDEKEKREKRKRKEKASEASRHKIKNTERGRKGGDDYYRCATAGDVVSVSAFVPD